MSYLEFPEHAGLAVEERVKRGTASINISWPDKEVFDAIQWWLTYKLGREANQWDVFSYLLGEALSNTASPLASAVLFPT